MTRQQIINESRSYLNTPFHLQGRMKGVGVDCVGLVVGLCRAFNVPHEDCKTYDHNGKGADLLSYLRKWLVEIPIEEIRVGDIAAFWIKNKDQPRHVGIYSHCEIFNELTMIHTHNGIGKVCEHRLSGEWSKRICAVFKLPGVTD
jgi:NlpC/P60 family putative phage cell wall peptidase